MVRQVVDIGIEGNDNTGDSIRESFRKVNENFNELYAVFGLGGQISITNLRDVPSYDTGNKLLAVNQTANGINFLRLASDSELSGGGVDSIGFEFSEDGSTLIVKQLTSKISNDTRPQLSGPLDARGYAIANVGTSQEDVNEYNSIYSPAITLDDLVITKAFADRNYQAKTIAGGGTRLRDEPLTVDEYTVTSTNPINLSESTIVVNHGLSNNYTGAAFVFKSTVADPIGVESGETYYIRIVDANSIALFNTAEDAVNNVNRIPISGGSGTFTLTDASYDSRLAGNWLSNEALPRKSIVRRQGDRMEGPLYLYDHPGDLAGNDYENLEDLQAATKLYVDSVSSASQINLFVKTDGDDSQTNSPFGKEGRSNAYAFKTIGAAAKKAEELIAAAPIEPGPYMQTITHSNKTVNSVAQNIVFINSAIPTRINSRNIIIQNKKFLQKEAILFIKNTYPQFEFNKEIWEKDLELIIEAITLDIIAGNNANFLSRTVATRYYSSPTTKRFVTTYRTQTLAVHEYVKDIILTYILPSVVQPNPYQTQFVQKINTSLSIDPQAANAIQNKFAVIKNIVENGIFTGGVVDGQNTYKVYITNNNGFVDQGIVSNTDIIPGKLLRGKTSGAIGRIISYTREIDNTIIAGTDQIELQLVEPIEFVEGEEIEYGSIAAKTQITINVESGIYHEDYPIKISTNVSVNGDEFRRVIVRPKNRISQSTYANTYFYRDASFDNLNLFEHKNLEPLTKGYEYVNPITNTVDGYFGYHYLKDSRVKSNTGNVYENFGNWNTAYDAIIKNREFVVEQTVQRFNDTAPGVYDVEDFTSYVFQIVSAIAKDLLIGGNENALEVQGNYWNYAIEENIVPKVTIAVNYAKDLIKLICNKTAPSVYYGSNLEYPQSQWPDLSSGTSEPNLWESNQQYLRNAVIKVPFGASFEYYRCRIVHVSTNDFDIDKILYWIKIAGINETVDNLIDTVLFAYDIGYNPPRHNKEMDAFLMNDSTILRNITVQGHGGFMCVLDSNGQILNKSPYIQTGSSFSQSLNKQAFRGGMFVDGFVGNLEVRVTGKVGGDPFRLQVTSLGSVNEPQGLFVRRPETPCSFYIEGKRFQVNAVISYDQTAGTAELLLDKNSNEGLGFVGTVTHYGTSFDLTSLITPVPIVLQTAGNRSMLGNDFTQINDLGYGLICVNGALSEMVSMFTYYCRAGYYAKNGSEIRSLTGSTCYGEYGLVAEGADPNEIPDRISLVNDMTQPARIFEAENIIYFNNPVSASAGDTISQTRIIGGIPTTITAKVVVDTANSQVLYIKNVEGAAFDTTNNITNLDTATNLGTAYEIDAEPYLNTVTSLSMYVFDMKDIPLSSSELDVYHPIRNVNGRYEVRNATKTNAVVGRYKEVNNKIPTTGTVSGIGAKFTIQKTKANGYSVNIDLPGTGYTVGNQFIVSGTYLGGSAGTNNATIQVTQVTSSGEISGVSISGNIFEDEHTPFFSGQVYRLNFSRSDAQFSTLGLIEEVNWYTGSKPTTIEYRRNEDHIIDDIQNPATLTIRPSTALVFDENIDYVYRTTSFTQQDSQGNQLDEDVVQVSFDSPFDYIKLNIDQTYKNALDPLDNSKTLGATIGDINLAIRPITEPSAITRLSNSLRMIFAWKGAKYQVYDYREVILPGEIEPIYAIVSIVKLEDILNTGTGLSEPFDLPLDQITVRVGLAAGAEGDVTFNISTCRATGHDFLDAGSGGYNDSNYPNVIFGKSTNTTVSDGKTEINEISKGRVFYVSTDQNGVFRVGRFFTVDQGTGTVSFAASIALNDIDGIGFKRGVTVSEFSTDSAMSDNDENTVPVESAVRGHVNRRLGFNTEGRLVSNPIGPGVMSLGGIGLDQTPMKSNMSLGGYKIVNLANPTANTDAANKTYVDVEISKINGLGKLDGVTLTATPASGSVLAFTGTGQNTVNASVSGVIGFTLNANTITSTINNNVITNDMISSSSPIQQSKLLLNNATADIQANATKGIASFDSTFFDSSSGWVSIKDNGIEFNKLSQVGAGTVLGRTTGTGNLSAITFEQVVGGVGGLTNSSFNTTAGVNGVALIRTATTPSTTYAVTAVTTTGENNSIVKTNANGSVQVRSVILGSDSTQEVLALSGASTVLRTPTRGVIITSSGGSPTVSPLVTLPGSVVIGTGNADRSTLQANAAVSINNTSRLKVDWIHTSFIEAAGEKDASSTGIAIGANTGRTIEGEVGIVTANISNNTSVVPFIFSSTGARPDVNNVYDIGSETRQYKNIWAETFNGTATSAYYADLAENYLADASYEPGTVLVFGGTYEVTVYGQKGTHRVAGVVSTCPAHLMNSMLKGEYVVALALQGRVPCKVLGTVRKGDLLVNSGVAGFACVDNNAKAGTIIGKSLEDKTDTAKGIVEIVVGKH
jgi:hypothetical protein